MPTSQKNAIKTERLLSSYSPTAAVIFLRAIQIRVFAIYNL